MYLIINIKLSNTRVNPNIRLCPNGFGFFREREIIMTSFINPGYAQEHPGVQRAEAVVEAAGRFRRTFDSTKGLAAMLLAALVAALMVVADQLVSVWADGYLLASWVTLWAIAFAALALMAPTAHRLAAGLSSAWTERLARLAQRQADERYWASAKSDPRVMAELQAAILRSEHASESKYARQPDLREPAASLARVDALNAGSRYLRHI
jgi:hypothetical protein